MTLFVKNLGTIVAEQTLGYETLSALLTAYIDAVGAAECHGILCGMLSCHSQLDTDAWLRAALFGDRTETLSQEEAAQLTAELWEPMSSLQVDAQRQLDDPELNFTPLLPDDESPMQERTERLASWCQGYLYGLSLGQLQNLERLSPACQEFSKDLLEISRLAYDDDMAEKESERAFFDIVEYVRMGVLMLRDELLSARATEDEPITLH